MTDCRYCGAADLACRPAVPVGRFLTIQEQLMSDYTSRERVYEENENGYLVLKYAVGDPIPEDEAKRQGLRKSTKATKATRASSPQADGGD